MAAIFGTGDRPSDHYGQSGCRRGASSRCTADRLAGIVLAAGVAFGMVAWPMHVHAEPVTSRMLVETTDITGVSMSPDGLTVAYRLERASIERNTHASDWYVMAINRVEQPLRIAAGGEPLQSIGVSLADAPQWSPDSLWIYFRALSEDGVQVWRAARDGTTAEQVTHDPADVDRFQVSRDGRSMTYEVGATRDEIERAEQQEYDHGILFDQTTDGLRNLYRSTVINGRLSTGQRTINQVGLLSDRPRSYRMIDTATGEISPAGSTTGIANFAPEDGATTRRLSADGGRVAELITDATGSRLRVTASENAGSWTCNACLALAIEGFEWRASDELIVTARTPERVFGETLYGWKPETDSLRLIIRTDGRLTGGEDRFGTGFPCATGARYAVCVVESADSPPRLERVDLDTGTRTILVDPNARLAEAGQAGSTVEFRTWTDQKGRVFTGYLFRPTHRLENTRIPLFITYYRCSGYLRGGFGDEWPLIPMASEGIASLCINTTRSEERGNPADYEVALSGVEAIIQHLDDEGLVDRSRVGMGGLSFGSEVAMWIAGKSNLLAAVSVASPQASPYLYWATALLTGRSASLREVWGLGAPEETPEAWRQISPALHADKIVAPVLMQLSEGEYRANIELHARLTRLRRSVEMRVFPNEAHWKYEPRHKFSAYERNLDWFRFWLLGYEDPDSAKADQYRRWREMRAARDVAAPSVMPTPPS